MSVFSPTLTQTVYTVRPEGEQTPVSDYIANEVPVALVYNGISHVVMMTTPADLADFALGFSLSEGILNQPCELYDLELEESAQGISINMEIATACFTRLKDYRRTLAGRTGCGICGVDSLSMVRRPAFPPIPPAVALSRAALFGAINALPQWQKLNQQTGSLHAAAWVDQEGNIQCVREDVGRHVALDKLIGARAGQRLSEPGFVLVTSRASYEMVQKAIMAQISTLVAVSAPTSMAIELAEEAGMTLIGFARSHQAVVYTGMDRF